MMWGTNTIANFKENFNKIVFYVHHSSDEEDDHLPARIFPTQNGNHSSSSHSTNCRSFSPPILISGSPVANGVNPTFNLEIKQYKAEIKRLQSSEAEIKALSVNYAALLKQKEDQILRLNKENGSLKQNLDEVLSASKSGTLKVHANGVSTTKELADLPDIKNHSAAALQNEIKQIKEELQQERNQLAQMHQRFQDEHQLKESLKEELNLLKLEREKTSKQMSKIQNELNQKISEIKCLQVESNKEEANREGISIDSLRNAITILLKENTTLKREKNDLETALEESRSLNARQTHRKDPSSEVTGSSSSFPGKEEMEKSIQKLQHERDKAVQQWTRLKQHLLEKESEESEKMDADSKIIEELRASNEYLKAQVSRLEKALKQVVECQQDLKTMHNNEIQKSRGTVDDLNKKLAKCMGIIEAKDIELLNLQSALGQYYAEIEAKEYLEGELSRSREESARVSQLLKDAGERAEVSRAEKEQTLAKLSQTERTLAEWKGRAGKLEEDNAKVRRALEQSMKRLNRMSVESDYLVDRRIVIKLLVTYFQRNHSKEVLDLMVRMLGFSDEDKLRIGVAQLGTGRRVVRGVLSIPGKLVGGILGGSSTEAYTSMGSENETFSDLWVDFLLKEEERERREAAIDSGRSPENLQGKRPSAVEPPQSILTAGLPLHSSSSQNSIVSFHGNFQHSGRFSSEFSTIPLTSTYTSLPRMLST